LEQVTPKHEKIRFRRHEIARLSELPSACAQERLVPEPKMGFRIVPIFAWSFAAILLVALAVPAAVFLFGIPGIGGERIRIEAEAALTRMAGFDVDAAMGDPHLSVDASRFIAFQVDDVRISRGGGGANLVEAGSLRFGLRFLPLLTGQVRLGSAGIEDARISLSALPPGEGPNATLASLTGPDGLIDPGLVMKAAFSAVHRTFEAFDAGATRRLISPMSRSCCPQVCPAGHSTWNKPRSNAACRARLPSMRWRAGPGDRSSSKEPRIVTGKA
jgi:hypothetical protein